MLIGVRWTCCWLSSNDSVDDDARTSLFLGEEDAYFPLLLSADALRIACIWPYSTLSFSVPYCTSFVLARVYLPLSSAQLSSALIRRAIINNKRLGLSSRKVALASVCDVSSLYLCGALQHLLAETPAPEPSGAGSLAAFFTSGTAVPRATRGEPPRPSAPSR